MNKKRIVACMLVLLVATVACFLFTACNKTSDIDDFGKAMTDAGSGEIETSMSLFGMDIEVVMKFDGNKTWNSAVLIENTETYTETVDGKIYVYTKSDSGWIKSEEAADTSTSDSLVDNPDELSDMFDGSKYKYSVKEKAFVPKKGETIGNDVFTVKSMTIKDGVCVMKVKVKAEGMSVNATITIKNLNNTTIVLPAVSETI